MGGGNPANKQSSKNLTNPSHLTFAINNQTKNKTTLKEESFYIIENVFLSDDINQALEISLTQGSGRLLSNICDTKEKNNQKNIAKLETLQNIIFKHKFNANFIKIDTDGFDFKVIRSAKNFLASSKPILFFEWDRAMLEAQDEDYLSIFDFLRDMGYSEALIFDNFGSLLCVLNLSDVRNLALIMGYVKDSNHRIYYYDVCVLGENIYIDELLEFLK